MFKKKKKKIKVESKTFHKKHITQKYLLFLISYKDYVNWIQFRCEVYLNVLKSF